MKTQKNPGTKQKQYRNVTIIRWGMMAANVIAVVALLAFVVEIIQSLTPEERGFWGKRSELTVNICGIVFVLLIWLLIFVMVYTWCITVTGQRCDWDSYRVYVERALKKRPNRNSVRLHLTLLAAELVLGRYDECQAEIEEINRLESRLSKEEKIVFKQHCISYLYGIGDRGSCSEKLKELSEILQCAEKINENTRKALEENILLLEYLVEDNWEEIVSLLEKSRSGSVYAQVNDAYYLGKAYYHTENYEAAFSQLSFVAMWGGNTKYVSLAKEMLSAIPEKEKYEGTPVEKPLNRNGRIYKRLGFCLAWMVVFAGICVLAFFGSNISADSMEKAYCKEYWIDEKSRVTVLYQEDFNNYKMAVLYDGDKIGYCLYEKIEKESGDTYKIIDSLRTERHIETAQLENAILQMQDESERESYQKSIRRNFVTMQMWTVLEEFYRENGSFYPEGFSYTGVSCYSDMKDYEIEGRQVEVEPAVIIDGTQFYIWHIEGVDLDTLDFLTFVNEYYKRNF